jgi:hypothetical protein
MISIPRSLPITALLALAVAWRGAAAFASDSGALIDAQPAPYAARAERELVDRLFLETGAVRELPTPSWTEYIGMLGNALLRALFSRFPEINPPQGDWARVVAWGLLAVIVAGLMVILIRWILPRRGASARTAAAVVLDALDRARSLSPSRDAWREEIRKRLAGGDVDGALEALWWWFARSVLERAIDPSWTSRELLIQAGRPDLQRQAVLLDRMLYGPVRPRAADILRLARTLEGALA